MHFCKIKSKERPWAFHNYQQKTLRKMDSKNKHVHFVQLNKESPLFDQDFSQVSHFWFQGFTDECRKSLANVREYCTLGWVNLYKKFELKNIQFVVNSFYKKNGKDIFCKFFFAQLACGFAWICKYLQASCIQHFQRYAVKNLTESSFT